MELIDVVRRSHVSLMNRTVLILGHILQSESRERLTTLTDGPDGWTVSEVVCHLRDFDEIFLARARRIVAEDNPTLIPFDEAEMARERDYRSQDPYTAFETLAEHRRTFAEFYKALTPEQWERSGIHPEYGDFNVTRTLLQVGHHDVNHLEQITRILTQPLPA
jgi:hypothetical protein